MNVYRAAADTWFVLIVTSDKLPAVAESIGRPDLLTDPRFSDPQKLTANMEQLIAILDDVFNKVRVTFGAVRGAGRGRGRSSVEAQRYRRSSRGRWRQTHLDNQ